MALLKVFVSSTCYDLNIVRAQLRSFLINLGHDPVMSDYNDVLFDPRSHTHEDCIKEISNADVVVLIIGSRFGGRAVPIAVGSVDIENLKKLSTGDKVLENPAHLSITQLEILKAIESGIPIFTFVDARVMHDHLFYEKNKDKGILDKLDFPSIEKKETAYYIFEFINFLRLRSKNNSLIEFTKSGDIEEFIRKQWSALLQRLLIEQRRATAESRQIEAFSEELKDIKSLILSNIASAEAKEVGRGVLKYRRLVDFLFSLSIPDARALVLEEISWDELLKRFDLCEIAIFEESNSVIERQKSYIIKSDRSFFHFRFNLLTLKRMEGDWETFRHIPYAVKNEIISALVEDGSRMLPYTKYEKRTFEEFLAERVESGKTIEALRIFSLTSMFTGTPDDPVSEQEDLSLD